MKEGARVELKLSQTGGASRVHGHLEQWAPNSTASIGLIDEEFRQQPGAIVTWRDDDGTDDAAVKFGDELENARFRLAERHHIAVVAFRLEFDVVRAQSLRDDPPHFRAIGFDRSPEDRRAHTSMEPARYGVTWPAIRTRSPASSHHSSPPRAET